MKVARSTRWLTRTKTLPQGKWQFQDVADDQLRQPEAWGSDVVTQFLRAAQQNTYLTINAHRAAVKRVIEYFELSETATEAFWKARKSHDADDEQFVGFDVLFAFFIAAQRSLYAATTLIFSSQQGEATKPLRGAIETALYTFHIFHNPQALDVWAERPTADDRSPTAKQVRARAGAEFSAPRILRALGTQQPKLAALLEQKYEELIDAGGHYNLPAFRHHTSIRTLHEPFRRRFDFRLIGATAPERQFALQELVIVAGATMRTFDLVFREMWGKSIGERIAGFNRSHVHG